MFKNFDWSGKSIAKVGAVIILGLIALSIAASLISVAFRTIVGGGSFLGMNEKGYGGGYATEEGAYYGDMALGNRAMAPSYYPEPGFSTGTDAEDFEVKSYDGTINTRKLDKTCDTIANLKAKDYVIFENSNKNDESCYYRFKVLKANEAEIVKLIEDMDPEVFNANIQSIKQNVKGIDNELDILGKKLKSIEETLGNAQTAYDEISVLATKQQDAETLAKIIDSKLNLIERLTSERMNIKSMIDQYNQSKSDQLDQLDFTFFNISVIKDLIFDWKQIKDSWKFEAKELVRNLNEVVQAISLHLVIYLAIFVQAILYFFIAIFLLKFVWIGTKKIWKGKLRKK